MQLGSDVESSVWDDGGTRRQPLDRSAANGYGSSRTGGGATSGIGKCTPKYLSFTSWRDDNQFTAASVDLPSPTASWDQTISYFKSKGLGTLLGRHCTDFLHCLYICDCLYNFNGTDQSEPSMDPDELLTLRNQCRQQSSSRKPDPTVFLVPNSTANYTFSNSYYTRALVSQAMLGINQQLISTSDSVRLAKQFAWEYERFSEVLCVYDEPAGELGGADRDERSDMAELLLHKCSAVRDERSDMAELLLHKCSESKLELGLAIQLMLAVQ